jgi:hypothetical protein
MFLILVFGQLPNNCVDPLSPPPLLGIVQSDGRRAFASRIWQRRSSIIMAHYCIQAGTGQAPLFSELFPLRYT